MEDFWGTLVREVDLLLSGAKSPSDFVTRFYLLVEERPVHLPPRLLEAFEQFHEEIGSYEADRNLRAKERGLIGDENLKECARRFLGVIKDFLGNGYCERT